MDLLIIISLILFALVVMAASFGMVIVLRERMSIEERLDRYCQEA